MDDARGASDRPEPAGEGTPSPDPGGDELAPGRFGPHLLASSDPAGGRRSGRHAGRRAVASSRVQDPGLALIAGSVGLVVVGVVALAVGWAALLVVIALIQVLFARAWTDYLELPGATFAAAGIVVVGAIADAGVVVARLADDADVRAGELVPLGPAFGVCFLIAVVAQLARRDRDGVLAGLVATTAGGAAAAALAMWVQLEGAPAGARWVVVGFAAAGLLGVLIGAVGWVRQTRAPRPALLLPVLLALLAGPFYVLGRIVAG